MEPHHHISPAVIRSCDDDVTAGKTGIEETLLHRVCGRGRAAYRIRCVDFNELRENVVGKLAGSFIQLRGAEECACE